MSGRSVRVVNVVPRGRSKYALEKNNFQNNGFSEQEEKQKTKAILSSMKPGSLTSLASEDVNCIIIKTEDDCEPPTTEEKRLELVKVDNPIKEVGKKQQEVQPVTGPFQCLQDGCCQRIFFSCCEYSTHYWDEHTLRRKGLRCQVCEKPLSLDVDEQHPYACDAAIPDGGSSEEIAAEALSDSQGLNAKHRRDGLVEASAEIHEGNNKWSQLVDAAANASNWCQYQGQIDYRTIIKIPRFPELRFYGGGESARLLDVNLKHYNSPAGYAHKFGATVQKKRKLSTDTGNGVNQTSQATEEGKTNYEDIEKTSPQNTDLKTVFTKTINSIEDSTIKNANMGYDQKKQEKCLIVKKNISNKQKRINTYICDVCKINFISKHMLECHMNLHTVLRQKHNTLDTQHKKNDVNIVKNNEQILKGEVCNFCNKSFVRKRDFTRHIRTHTGEKPYQCNVCNKCFAHKTSLTTHIRTHTGEKPYQCNVCNKDFARKTHLILHLRTHTGEKPYQCNVCNKYFPQKPCLTRHIKTHTGEKPYQCYACYKDFSQKCSLTRHIRSHTGEKPYQCNVCNKYFANKSALTTHIRTPTCEKPYQCNVCNKYFAYKTSLSLHIRTHTGEKPYQCNVCNKYFAQKCNLTTHIRTHTGEKPYQCNVCNKYFAYKSALTTHNYKDSHMRETISV